MRANSTAALPSRSRRRALVRLASLTVPRVSNHEIRAATVWPETPIRVNIGASTVQDCCSFAIVARHPVIRLLLVSEARFTTVGLPEIDYARERGRASLPGPPSGFVPRRRLPGHTPEIARWQRDPPGMARCRSEI